MVKKVEAEPKVEEPMVEPSSPEPEAPISENEEDEALRKEIERLSPFEKNFKSLQQKYQGLTDAETGIRSEVSELKDMIKILAAAQSQGLSSEDVEDMSPERKVDLRKQWEELEKKQTTKRTQEEYNRKADTLYSQAQEMFKDNPDAIDEIEDLLLEGKIQRAEKKLQRAEVKMPDKETEQQKFERFYQEKRKQERIDAGELDAEIGEPAGSSSRSFTKQQIAEMPDDEWLKLQPEIDKAIEAGRIK